MSVCYSLISSGHTDLCMTRHMTQLLITRFTRPTSVTHRMSLLTSSSLTELTVFAEYNKQQTFLSSSRLFTISSTLCAYSCMICDSPGMKCKRLILISHFSLSTLTPSALHHHSTLSYSLIYVTPSCMCCELSSFPRLLSSWPFSPQD